MSKTPNPNAGTMTYARWFVLMILEANEQSLDEADTRVELMRRLCGDNEIATGFWFRTMPMWEANKWLELCRNDRATAREQLAQIQESFAKMATGVSVEGALKV